MTGDTCGVANSDKSAANYKVPLSGPILGAVVRELRLQNDVLTDKTARRYFSGQRVKDDSKREVLLAIGEALVVHGIITESPVMERVGLPLKKILSLGVACTADHWDRLVGHMRYTSTPVDRPDLVAISYLRLAIIDLALRISAALWLAELPTPDEETPLWAEDKGGAKYLRQLLVRCGVSRPTREQLTEELEVSDNTLDNWLDTNIRPSRDNIDRIADALAPHIGDLDSDTLKSQLHRHYALCALCDLLATHTGRDEVVNLATALIRFTSRTLAGLRQVNRLNSEDAARVLLPVMLFGTQFGNSFVAREHLLPALWRQECDRVWRTDLMAASKPWFIRLAHVGLQAHEFDQSTQIAFGEFRNEAEDVFRNVIEARDWSRVPRDLDKFLRRAMQELVHRPESAECHYLVGSMLSMVGAVDIGIQECWISACLAPTWESPRVQVGIILLNAGRNQEAREHLENLARGQDDLSPHLAFNLGVARLRTGDAAGGLAALEQAIEVQHDHARALDIAAHCAFLIGDEVKGRRLAKLADQLGHSETYREWREGKYRARNRST